MAQTRSQSTSNTPAQKPPFDNESQFKAPEQSQAKSSAQIKDLRKLILILSNIVTKKTPITILEGLVTFTNEDHTTRNPLLHHFQTITPN